MRLLLLIFAVTLFACQSKQQEKPASEINSVQAIDSTDAFEKDAVEYDYRDFMGIYDHESTAKGFSAVLSLRQNGKDMYFTISVSQGSCKGETEGVVMIIEQTEVYFSGFYESENCRLQFTLQRSETKVDVKEVTLCQLLGGGCSFEGTYAKRKD
jgi:hypothetical protein